MTVYTTAHVAFNTPLEKEIGPPPPVYRGSNLTHLEMSQAASTAIAEGFNEGAIVVLRSRDVYARRRPFSWGVVNGLNRYKAYDDKGFSPLSVRWVNGDPITKQWPDELYLIHRSMNDVQFDEKLKGQD